MTATSTRRAILAGAAALPALAVPAVAHAEISEVTPEYVRQLWASADPSVKKLIGYLALEDAGSDADLFALEKELKAATHACELNLRWQRKLNNRYKRAIEAAGLERPEFQMPEVPKRLRIKYVTDDG